MSKKLELREKSTVESYYVRCSHSGWARILLDEKSGLVSITSDYGNYAYTWSCIGEQTLKEFISKLDYDYFMGKTRGRGSEPMINLAIINIKGMILDKRKQSDINKETARDCWEELGMLADHQSSESFYSTITNCCPTLCDNYDHFDLCHIPMQHPHECKSFWAEIWIPFINEIIKKEIS